MSWKFVGDKLGKVPLPGVPLEATDAQFNAALKEYEALNGEGTGAAVKASGLYEQTKEAATTPAKEG
jgi:hypothetical protein